MHINFLIVPNINGAASLSMDQTTHPCGTAAPTGRKVAELVKSMGNRNKI